MFTGIVSGPYEVSDVKQHDGLLEFDVVTTPQCTDGLEVGASVAIDGVCLTATRIQNNAITFDAMQQTLNVTTLGEINEGYKVNVERSFDTGQEVGGHIVSGHIDGTAEIISIEQPENNYILKLRIPEELRKYVFVKGFLAVNGCSLTVADFDKQTGELTIYLIPETLRQTSFASKQVGDRVNIEVDRATQTMVDSVREYIQELKQSEAL